MALGQKTGGRTKGTPNKTTASVKNALIEAFEELGGVEALADWGRAEPGEFYKLWVKIMPTEVKAEHTGADGTPLGISIEFVRTKE